MYNDYVVGISKPKYLCRWWMKSRYIKSIWTPSGWTAKSEFYCPWYAKPLDFIWKLIFGNPKLIRNKE